MAYTCLCILSKYKHSCDILRAADICCFQMITGTVTMVSQITIILVMAYHPNRFLVQSTTYFVSALILQGVLRAPAVRS